MTLLIDLYRQNEIDGLHFDLKQQLKTAIILTGDFTADDTNLPRDRPFG
jgi:hypothetical protein